jgi:electron-transferring-flavoprotein dehydrogenase
VDIEDEGGFNLADVERAQDEVDVCIVGGGPAGLSAAIRLKQLEQEKGREIRVVVLEKGAEVGEFAYLSSVRRKLTR